MRKGRSFLEHIRIMHALRMFITSELEDVVRIDPWKFDKDTNEVIRSSLNRKFANKVEQACN